MEKLKINLDVLLPDIPDERDACVDRIIVALHNKRGIDTIHIVPAEGLRKSQLCFHYDPLVISVQKVQDLAREAGASVSNRYKHLITEVNGFRHQRQTNSIEKALKAKPGILSVGSSSAGILSIEYDTQLITREKIVQQLANLGIQDRQHDHKHDHPHNDHGHQHNSIFGKNAELIFSITSGLLIGIGYTLHFIPAISPVWSTTFYVATYFFGGFFTAREAIQAVSKGGFEIDFLMLVAAIGAAALGNWVEGALLLFLFSLGHALEHYAMGKAKRSIEALTDLSPKTAILKKDGQTREVPIEELEPGDTIVVRPNTKISADGYVILGTSSVNQAPVTGESIPVDKHPAAYNPVSAGEIANLPAEARVFAGTINGNGLLEIVVTKIAADSTVARLVQLVNEAQTQKSPTQQLTDKIERIFVPSILTLVALLCFAFLVIDEPFSSSFYRAMAVLVAASPCALAISTPSAVLSGIARAARAGVLIKGGRPLEDLGVLTALAFDKTGTLTEGKPRLTQAVVFHNTLSADELLSKIIAIESLSDHPIAKAIVRDGTARLGNTVIPTATSVEAILGKGIKAQLEGSTYYIGNLTLFKHLDDHWPAPDIEHAVKNAEQAGQTTMLVRCEDQYLGMITVMDTPRPEAKHTVQQLKAVGIRKMVMLTGDNQQVADAVASQIGIDTAMGNLLPEQKVAAIEQLTKDEARVAMIGDGVNDAPAMAKSTVGIAMGAAGSDVALETADIALMGDQLSLLPFAIGLSRKAKSIIRQNLMISMGMVCILVPSTIMGWAGMGPAVIGHEGSTLVVVLNALRLLGYQRKVSKPNFQPAA